MHEPPPDFDQLTFRGPSAIDLPMSCKNAKMLLGFVISKLKGICNGLKFHSQLFSLDGRNTVYSILKNIELFRSGAFA